MKVVAIKEIGKGEEVVTSYVDVGLRRDMRRNELRERYKFKCGCELCGRVGWVDPREALCCRKEGCERLASWPDEILVDQQTVICEKCGDKSLVDPVELRKVIADGEVQLARAEKEQYESASPRVHSFAHRSSTDNSYITDPTSTIQLLLRLNTTLQRSRLAPTSHPFLASLQVLLSTLLHTGSFTPALPLSSHLYTQLCILHPTGHPTRAIALAAWAKLRASGSAQAGEEGERYWRDERGLREVVELLKRSGKEVEEAFGSEKGGVLRGELRELERQTEEGMKMAGLMKGM